ncbi:hypothetical protein ACSDR0_17935 [Streptosporangium sp. G11]|uniref:hypothetical protein n=1 Tax=Streptosporangium sp. G11 TaxID=3436926 RepID=UPI003EB7602B
MPGRVVADIGHGVVAEVFPEELPVFAAVSSAYFDDPDRTLAGKDRNGGPLGFGLAEVTALMTPAVLWVVQVVVQHYTQPYVEKGADGLRSKAARLFRRRGKGVPGPDDVDVESLRALTPEQRAELRGVAVDAARRRGLSPDQAELIADAIVHRIPGAGDEQSPPNRP